MNKIKYLFSVCFVTVLVFCMGVNVRAEESEIDTSVFEYEVNRDGTIRIIGYTGTDETVVIPSEIDGKSVVSIGSSAFYKCETIKHLIIQEGLEIIEIGAFAGCESLVNIDIPDTVNIIESEVFGDCLNLSSIKLPNGLRLIESGTFLNCKYLQTIELPNGVIAIGDGAFSGCESLTKIVIPDSVKIIDSNVFSHSMKTEEGYTITTNKILENLVIYADPNSYARTYAYKNGIKFSCLNTHDWDNGIITVEPTIKSEGQITYTCTACGTKKTETLPTAATPKKGKTISAFNSQDVYKVTKSGTKNGTVEFVETNNVAITDISIPDTVTISGITYKVTSVAKNAFKSNKNLKKITIGKNVAKINAGAFNGCKNLSVINIKSKKLSSVGKNAFKGIKAKAKIKVPSSRLSKYKKLFSGKGQKSTVKITK